LPSKNSSNVS
jgi:hypothetical protein